jgi:hypothetical protein
MKGIVINNVLGFFSYKSIIPMLIMPTHVRVPNTMHSIMTKSKMT